MKASTPIERIGQILQDAGFKTLPSPLQIGSISFEVAGAYIGTHPFHDLIVVTDTAFDNDAKILRNVQGITRALDIARSKRPVTLVIAGPRPSAETMESLVRVCRVLPVGVTDTKDSEEALENWLAVLMPLKIPNALQKTANPIGEMAARTDGLTPTIANFIEVAPHGVAAVRDHLHAVLNRALDERA